MAVRAAFMLLLFGWGIWGAFHDRAFLLLHGVDLLIHECGHLVFALFGSEVLTALGGTLLQLIMPIAFTVYFFRRQQRFAGGVTLFWVGQNFFDIAVYMRDARALALPLIGIGGSDDSNGHDWNFLFSAWGVLAHDLAIARVVAAAGWLCLFAAVSIGLYYSMMPDGSEAAAPMDLDEEPVEEMTTMR